MSRRGNDYVRDTLRYGPGIEFKSGIPIYSKWDYKHQPPGADKPLIALPNVLPDLAIAMKQNPDLKVMVNGGYFDVSTPYFEGKMEMRHLPVPPSLRGNIEYHYYESGHMVYVAPAVAGRAARQCRGLHPADERSALSRPYRVAQAGCGALDRSDACRRDGIIV